MAILAVGFGVTMRLLLVLLPVAGGLLAVVLSGIAGRIALYLEDVTYRIRARSLAQHPPAERYGTGVSFEPESPQRTPSSHRGVRNAPAEVRDPLLGNRAEELRPTAHADHSI